MHKDNDDKNQKLPLLTKISWGAGGVSDNIMKNAIMRLALPIYNIGFGVNPVLVTWALGIPRLWDAFSDPLMGNISDNTKCKFGRRRPYIAIGAVLSCLLFILMWCPPMHFSTTKMFVFFLVTSIFYFTASTIWSVPWNALGFELTPDYNDRTRVMSYRAFFANAATVLILPWAYKLCFKFGNAETEGVRIVAIILGGLILLFGLLPIFFCKENIKIQKQRKIGLIEAIKNTLANKPFLILCGITFNIIVGLFMVMPFQNYINIYYVYNGDKNAAATIIGVGGTLYGIVGILSAPLVSFLGTRFGKKKTILLGQLLVIISSLSTWFLYTPKHPYLQLVYMAMSCPGLSCIWILGNSMLADICDIDELNSGLRREGLYGAVYSWLFKAGMSTVMILSGYMVKFSGYSIDFGANQPPETIFKLRFFFAIIPAIFVFISFLLALLYPLTQQRMQEVRNILDTQKK